MSTGMVAMSGGPASLYEKLVAAGCKVDHHESDLYVKITPKSTQLLLDHGLVVGGSGCRLFVSATDRAMWADIPFGYAPFWDLVTQRANAVREARASISRRLFVIDAAQATAAERELHVVAWNRLQVERMAPWACAVIPVDGGWMAFESGADAAKWEAQR